MKEQRIYFKVNHNLYSNYLDKEKKWGELERIVVNYARKDVRLRNKLSEIKYIWDDPSSKRRITTVVKENEELKIQIDEMKSEIEEIKSQMGDSKSIPTWIYEDEDYFELGCQIQENEVSMNKLTLVKKKHPLPIKNNKTNMSGFSDMKNSNINLDQAFIDRSRIDTSNLMDDGSILGPLKNEKELDVSGKDQLT